MSPVSSARPAAFAKASSGRAALLTAVAVSLALNATAVWWGLPSRFGWAPDELHPRVIQEGIGVRFSGDWHQPAYPPLHYYVLAVAESPVLLAARANLVDPSSVLGTTLLFYLGRLVSLLMGVGILLAVYRLGRETFSEAAGVFSVISASLIATFVYYAKTANLDVPLTFWVVWSLVYWGRFQRSERRRDLLLFTATSVAAMCTKDQAYAFYVLPVAFYLVRRVLDERAAAGAGVRVGLGKALGRAAADKTLWIAAGSGLALFLGIHNVVFNFQGFVHHFEEILWARGHYSAFEGSAPDQIGLLVQTGRHVVFSMGWPLALLALGGVVLATRSRNVHAEAKWILLSALSYYCFFIAPVLSTWLRYSVPLTVILSVFSGQALSLLWSTRRVPMALTRIVTAGVLLYSLGHAGSVNLFLLSDSRYSVERWMRDHVEPAETVGYMGPEYYLPRMESERYVFDTRRLRATESVLLRQLPDFLVFNSEYADRFSPDTREGDLFGKLRAGRTSYALVHRDDRRNDYLLNFEGVLANIDKVSPSIEIYELAR